MMLNSIFSDDMMIQCDTPIKVWGIDTPGQAITVELASETAEAIADADGKWSLTLSSLTAGTACEMRVTGSEIQIVKNILAGDVWLCSGQSNMEFALKDVDNAAAEIASADYPEIRFFNVAHEASIEKTEQVEGEWKICSPKTAEEITGVGYFFAREIHKSQGKPIGLLHSSWGGTRVETWISRDALLSMDFKRDEIEKYEATISDPSSYEQEFKEWNAAVPQDPENRGYEKGYASPSHDVSNWKTIDVPGYWTKQGLEFNGVLWYRMDVVLPEGWDGQECLLHIGACDKSDQTYFNNEKIGGISIADDPQAFCADRIYDVPANIVKAGENTIALRVFSNVNGGGIIGKPEDISIALKNTPEQSIPLAGKWRYTVEYDFGLIIPPVQPFGEGNANTPYMLFYNMIAPLVNFAIKGAIWYQGESNAANHQEYSALFSKMIMNWRESWNLGDFPFYLVQLASYIAGSDTPTISPWGEIRKAQEAALALKNTGMAVAIDIGDSVNIHPKNKQDVGKRLALIARAKTYGESVEFSGPVVQKIIQDDNEIRISFTHAKGLQTPANAPVAGFKLHTKTSTCEVGATIDGEEIVVKSDDLSEVVAISYAYADCPKSNLYNDANLPAVPFKETL